MNSAGRFVSGLLLGAALAAIVFFWPDSDGQLPAEAAPATTTTTTLPEVEPFVEPGEIVVGATALLPRGLEIEDGVAAFSYELVGLAPTLGFGDDGAELGDVLTLPELWVLTTSTGATVDTTTSPRADAARFELPSPDATVSQIEVITWRRATPFGQRVELPVEVGASATFRSGEAVIETVLDQRNSTIVQIDFDSTGDEWHNGQLRAADPRWRTSGRSGGGAQLLWEGPDAPTTVVLEDVSFEMRPIAEAVVVHSAESQP
jgi:hypothetical protein